MRPYELWALLGVMLPVAAVAQTQSPEPGGGTLDVFLDCHAPSCDFDHFRREISFVNWMRDRQDAEVHALVTWQRTGGGGREYTLHFIGRDGWSALEDTLHYVSGNTDTEAEIREGLTRTLSAGLVRYAARTPVIRELEITYRPGAAPVAAPVTPGQDPWRYWVFRTSLSGSIDGESSERGYSTSGSFSASRTTDAFKIWFSVRGNYRRDEFELDDTTTYIDERDGFDIELLSVRSLGPHWSAGFLGEADRSTFLNRDFGFRGGPAVEYSFFRYDESTRKQVTLMYAAGIAAYDFEEETIFGEMSQTLGTHVLELSVAVQQPWGSVFGGVEGSQFLHDLGAYRIDTRGGLNLRVFRGLNLNLNGSFSRIKDQIFLPAGGLTPEEILVRRRQRGTDYRFRFRTGLSFRFGSKFSNVVNPRMEG